MVVAAMSPDNAWQQPILRVVDTVVGVAVGVAAVWIGRHLRAGDSRHTAFVRHPEPRT
ncbi:MAG: Fusaric acid resistance protein-like [Gemmataceae bacterium]|nr:Fusaric acid resistance protein-like [Gemmataceae bacterium]